MPKVFICYSSIDYEFAYTLFCALKAAGIDVWLDKAFIKPGLLWRFEIQQALDMCTHLILIHTESSRQSKEVWSEWNSCLDAEKIVIPLIAQSGIKLPYPLAMHQHIKFVSDTFPEEYVDSSGELFNSAFDALLHTLLGDWQPQPPDGSGARVPIPVSDRVQPYNNQIKSAAERKDEPGSRSRHPQIFLSYRHDDSMTLKHFEYLNTLKEMQVFWDRDNFRQDDFFKSLTEKLKESDLLVHVLSKPSDMALGHENERSQILNKILNADYRELRNRPTPALNIIGIPNGGVGKTLLALRLHIYSYRDKQRTQAAFNFVNNQDIDSTVLVKRPFDDIYRGINKQRTQAAFDIGNNQDIHLRTLAIRLLNNIYQNEQRMQATFNIRNNQVRWRGIYSMRWIDEMDKRDILMAKYKEGNVNSLASSQPVATVTPTLTPTATLNPTETPTLPPTREALMSRLWQEIEDVVDGAFKRVQPPRHSPEQDKLCLNDTGHGRNESPEYSRDDIMNYSVDLS